MLSGQDRIYQEGAPGLVQLIDQGESDSRLSGLRSPRGIKIEIVAEGLSLPRALSFGSDGTPYVLSSQDDKGPAQLVVLVPTDAAGRREMAEVRMEDLPGRDSLLVHEGWFYLAGQGGVIRRHEHDAALLTSLRAAAKANKGPPTTLTPDGKWIEQQIIHRASSVASDTFGGLSRGFCDWIYWSVGTDSRMESWDGTKAAVLGSGGIFRFRPDGSRLQEYARGLAHPVGPLSSDRLGNCFQVERNSAGWRLIHVLEGGGYGWRSDWKLTRLDRPGTLPALIHDKTDACEGVLAYRGAAFPKFFQGLLLLLNSEKHQIRAAMPGEGADALTIGEPFVLLTSDDAKFVPTLATQGPDDAIYVFDSGGKEKGRLLRLTWSGTTSTPAIAPQPLKGAPPAEGKSLAIALDTSKSTLERARALDEAVSHWNKAAFDACLKIVSQDDAALERLAADALGDHLPDDPASQELLAGTLQDRLLHAAVPVRRSLYLALGKLGTKYDAAPEWIFEATSVTPEHQTNRYLFDGHVRALETPKDWAAELLLGNLDVALFDPNPEPEERQRLKQFVVATAEAMRTRELANFLDRLIRDEKDYFSKLELPLKVRLLATYDNVLVDPPVRADAIVEWLSKHPSAAKEVQSSAWATLASVGTAKPEPLVALVESMVATDKLDPALKPDIAAALEQHRDKTKLGSIDQLIERIKK